MRKFVSFLLFTLFVFSASVNAGTQNDGGIIYYAGSQYTNTNVQYQTQSFTFTLTSPTYGNFAATFPASKVFPGDYVIVTAQDFTDAGIDYNKLYQAGGLKIEANAEVWIWAGGVHAATITSQGEVDSIARDTFYFGGQDLTDMKARFAIFITPPAPAISGVNLTATYLPQDTYYVGDSTVSVGVNVKNNSSDNATSKAGAPLHIKIIFQGSEKTITGTVPNVGTGGNDYIVDFDAPASEGNYPVTINVNYDDNPHETLPTEATAHNDNIVNGTVVLNVMSAPPQVQGNIDLKTYVKLTGLDSSNRIKSGYGFGISNGKVRAENFYYQPTHNGYIKVVYAKINDIKDFGIWSNPSLSFIIGLENNNLKTASNMRLPSHRGILNWTFAGPVTAYPNGQVFTFSLDNNTYGAYGNKPLIYLPPKTEDATYNLSAGGGTAQTAYYMEQLVKWWHSTKSGGHWHYDYYHWWDYSNNSPSTGITIDAATPQIVVKGSMFDDDSNIVN